MYLQYILCKKKDKEGKKETTGRTNKGSAQSHCSENTTEAKLHKHKAVFPKQLPAANFCGADQSIQSNN